MYSTSNHSHRDEEDFEYVTIKLPKWVAEWLRTVCKQFGNDESRLITSILEILREYWLAGKRYGEMLRGQIREDLIIQSFARELQGKGLSRKTIGQALKLARSFIKWVSFKGIELREVTEKEIEEFIHERRLAKTTRSTYRYLLRMLLEHLSH